MNQTVNLENTKPTPKSQRPLQSAPTARSPQPAARASSAAPSKTAFGRFKNVQLTQEEHGQLLAEYGEKGRKAIDKLDIWLGARGDRYKSHYLAIHSWVLKAVDEDELKETARSASSPGSAPARLPDQGNARLPSTYAQIERANQKSVARLALLGRGVHHYGQSASNHHGIVHNPDLIQPEGG
jgi:hypothetical protein